MSGLLEGVVGGRALLVVAAAVEARAVLRSLGVDEARAEREWEIVECGERFDVVVSGVGKSAAAGATARFLDTERHGTVVSVGVAGALPGSGLELLDVVVATRAVFADEGFLTPAGFTDVASAGFPPGPEGGMGVACDAGIVAALRGLGHAGAVATVSTCSGTDDLAREIARRTGAIAEAMEGGAVGVTAQRVSRVAFGEVRVVSNTTGDRGGQVWDLRGAVARLGEVVEAL